MDKGWIEAVREIKTLLRKLDRSKIPGRATWICELYRPLLQGMGEWIDKHKDVSPIHRRTINVVRDTLKKWQIK